MPKRDLTFTTVAWIVSREDGYHFFIRDPKEHEVTGIEFAGFITSGLIWWNGGTWTRDLRGPLRDEDRLRPGDHRDA